MSQRHINTFAKGMNKDLAPGKVENTLYYNAEDLRLITYEDLNTGKLVSLKGNTIHFKLPIGWTYHGHGFIRDRLILFARDLTGNNDRLYSINLTNEILYPPTLLTLDLAATHQIYEGDLNFNAAYPIIRAIGRYETNEVQKIYFTDFYNPIRFCNVANPNLSTIPPDKFDILPFKDMTNVEIVSIGSSGALRAGMVQYSYQLYDLNGAESMTSPASNLVTLYADSLTAATTATIKGSEKGDNSGKSIAIRIQNIDEDYNRIRLIRVFYEDILLDPVISIVTEQAITGTFEYIDVGGSLEDIPLEVYRELTNLFKTYDLETKNNYLFAARIEEDFFDFEFDARAYRYNGFNESVIYPVGSLGGYNIIDPADVDEDHDALNKYNELENDLQIPDVNGVYSNYPFIFQSDGSTLGGTGVNVSYRFGVRRMLLNESDTPQQYYVRTQGSTENPSYHDYTSPYIRANYLGYQRDEVYSFGLIGFDERARPSFVKWIGDIRFPKTGDILQEEQFQISKLTLCPADVEEGYKYGLRIWTLDDEGNRLISGGDIYTTFYTDLSTTAQDILEDLRTTLQGSGFTVSVPVLEGGCYYILLQRTVFNSPFDIDTFRDPEPLVPSVDYFVDFLLSYNGTSPLTYYGQGDVRVIDFTTEALIEAVFLNSSVAPNDSVTITPPVTVKVDMSQILLYSSGYAVVGFGRWSLDEIDWNNFNLGSAEETLEISTSTIVFIQVAEVEFSGV